MASGYPDFEGSKSKLYTVAEWAAKEGTDKNWLIADAVTAYGEYVSTTYNVPAGKTLYITHASFSIYAIAAADADNNSIAYAQIQDTTAGVVEWSQGGNGGGYASFTKPIVIEAGHQFYCSVINYSNHNCCIGLMVAGYIA